MAADQVDLMAGTRRRRAPVHGIWRIRGELDVTAFQRAVGVAGVHCGLASADHLPDTMSMVELGGGVLRDVVSGVVAAGSDVGVGSLVRVVLVRCDAGESVVVAVLHQLAGDRKLLGSFVSELWRAYGALVSGADMEAAGDSVVVSGDVAAADEAGFWRDELAGVPVFDFPSDRPRPGVKTFRGTGSGVVAGAGLVAGVRRLAAELEVAPDAVLLAGWGVVLARCSGKADFAVGVGSHRNVVPVRLRYAAGMSFLEWVGVVAGWLDAARSHGRMPFERIVAAVAPDPDPSRSPLYQVFFGMEPELPVVDVAGLVVEPLAWDTGFVAVDLELVATWTSADELRLRLDGNADLFDVTTLQGLVDRLPTVLAAAVADPTRPVSRLPVMTPAEQRRVLVDWNRSGVDVPDRCLHELIEQQVAAGADRVAVRCGGRPLTYRQLNDRANQLAVQLRHAGVGPESRVGMFVDRSVDSVVALLGILKAGGGYVPLDPSYPTERLRYMAADADLTAVVGVSEAQPVAVQVTRQTPFIYIPITEDDTPNPPHTATPRNLAYIIYTSGTTGQPKGVAVTHRQITASTNARWAYPDPGTDLMTLPLTFDAAAGGLHWMLTRGGTCLMATDDEIRDPRLMARLVRGNRITHINTLPSQYGLILDQTDPEDLAALCYVDVGGEVLPPSLVRTHYRRTPDALLTNCYGPTEATVWASVCDVRPHHAAAASVPIGRPIRNARIYLLDEHLNPVPPGTPAELYIGGETVARGYLNQPTLTAERFFPDPYGEPGQRMYRTGDRARHLPDGNIEFLGRVDHQVKVRGFRIELTEIENVILRHPHVTEAAVTVHHAANTQRLIAHVTGDHLTSLPAALKTWLTARMPAFMQPDEIRALAHLPRTATGKVDRAQLTDPEPEAGAGTEPSTVDGVASSDLGHLSNTQLDTLIAQLLSERGDAS